MVATTNPLQEKLTFLLHGHFPTAISKVRFPIYMYGQNQLFRTKGVGDFDALTQAVATDPAMLIWLDAASDIGSSPNENFARELMERFTMGIGTYTEDDVRAGAGLLLGLAAQSSDQRLHHRRQAAQQLAADIPREPDQLRSASHRPGHPQQCVGAVRAGRPLEPSGLSGHHPPTRWWPTLPLGMRPIGTSPICCGPSFEHPSFVSDASLTGLIKQPTEYVVGALRALGVKAASLGTRRRASHPRRARAGAVQPAQRRRLGPERVLAVDGRRPDPLGLRPSPGHHRRHLVGCRSTAPPPGSMPPPPSCR